jgi:hypothetical protein
MVTLKRLQVGIEMPETFPQRLKPSFFAAICVAVTTRLAPPALYTGRGLRPEKNSR